MPLPPLTKKTDRNSWNRLNDYRDTLKSCPRQIFYFVTCLAKKWKWTVIYFQKFKMAAPGPKKYIICRAGRTFVWSLFTITPRLVRGRYPAANVKRSNKQINMTFFFLRRSFLFTERNRKCNVAVRGGVNVEKRFLKLVPDLSRHVIHW